MNYNKELFDLNNRVDNLFIMLIFLVLFLMLVLCVVFPLYINSSNQELSNRISILESK